LSNLHTTKSCLALMSLPPAAAIALILLAHSPLARSVGRVAQQDAAADSQALDRQYLAASAAAMTKMMQQMHSTPSGDADRDFVAQMVPHHQGAIDMALAILRDGRNPQLRRLAQEIIVTQQQEITAMRLAIAEPAP
jgi:uncharacterized protein (DUF305 family)